MQRIDLHTHTTASDGSMTPAELVRHAKEARLTAIAVTDHDTVEGLEEAIQEGNRIGLEVIPGLEISVNFHPEMHILGFFPHSDYRNIRPVLQDLLDRRNERNPKIVARLNELGFDIHMPEVEEEAAGSVVGRPHIAKVMIRKGYVADMSEAFEKYLADGRPAYFKKEKLTPAGGIREIRKAGGIPVLAHPIYLDRTEKEMDALLAELVEQGLMGVEAIYVDNTPGQTRMLLELAQKHHLLVTGGSDFHGSFKPGIRLGTGWGDLMVPAGLLEDMKKA